MPSAAKRAAEEAKLPVSLLIVSWPIRLCLRSAACKVTQYATPRIALSELAHTSASLSPSEMAGKVHGSKCLELTTVESFVSGLHTGPPSDMLISLVGLQSAKRKAIGSDPETMSDLELWQLIVRCLHIARKKMGEQKRSTWCLVFRLVSPYSSI